MIAFAELFHACLRVGMDWREALCVSAVCTYRQHAKDRFLPFTHDHTHPVL